MLEKNIFTVKDLARAINVSETLIRRWCKNNQVKYSKTETGQFFFTKEVFDSICNWYKTNPPKRGRSKIENKKLFSITDVSKKISIESKILKQLINDNLIPYSITGSGLLYFTVEQINTAQKYINAHLNHTQYTTTEAAKLLEIDINALRLLVKLNKIEYIKTISGRILFTESQINTIKQQIDSGIPLLDSQEIIEEQIRKKQYYTEWYYQNRQAVQSRRKDKKRNKTLTM